MEVGESKDEAFEAVEGLPPTFGEFLASRSADSDGREAVVAPRTDDSRAVA